MKPIISTIMKTVAAASLCCVLGGVAKAQELGKVAICPAVYIANSGTPAAQAEAITALRVKLEKGGYTVADYDAAKTSWSGMGISMPTIEEPALTDSMIRLGKAEGAMYVLAPTFDFGANRTWDVPATYTTVKLNVRIIKVADGSTVYDRTETMSRTTTGPENFAALSRTEREQRMADFVVDVVLAGFTHS